MTTYRVFLVGAIIAACVLSASEAPAAEYRWQGDLSSNWNANGNWVDGSKPGANDEVWFNTAFNPGNNQPNIPNSAGNKTHDRIRVTNPDQNVTITIGSTIRLQIDAHSGNAIHMSGAVRKLTISGAGEFRQRGNDDATPQWLITGSGNLKIDSGAFVIENDVDDLTINVGVDRTVNIVTGSNNSSAGIIKSGVGTLTYGGNNSYDGETNVKAGTLKFATSDAIDDVSDLIFADGTTLKTGGYDDTLATLDISGTVTFDFQSFGTSNLAFADSSSVAWSSSLDIINFGGSDSIRFGTDSGGLTQSQLGDITIGGESVTIDPDGYLMVRSTSGTIPEPATMCALGLAVAGLGGYVRKRRRG